MKYACGNRCRIYGASLLNTARPMLEKEEVQDKAGDKIKAMLTYVHEHYGEQLTSGRTGSFRLYQ